MDIVNVERANMRTQTGLVGVFVGSIFLSAFLLFSVQPMFTKMVLPLLGGSSNVWNTAMVFFQAMLLGGYIYAHLISKFFALKWQILCHGALLCLGVLFLPLSIASGWEPPQGGAQAYWLIGLFCLSVGVPFFAISANAPLLQRWFSVTSHKDAHDPYFLYAASNAGSLLSLCLYPLVFEPVLRLRQQTDIWALGYGALVVAIVMAGLAAYRHLPHQTPTQAAGQPPGKPPGKPLRKPMTAPYVKLGLSNRMFWVFLAFVPSSLMLGVTSHMANNIASAPFLWIVPLALYLLTFIIVFAKNPLVTPDRLKIFFPGVIVVALLAGFVFKMVVIASILVSLACYFIITLMCHGRLAESRPAASNLTEFYIYMSLGGVLGGIFNALLAPILFSNVYEYILVLILAAFAVPRDTPWVLNLTTIKRVTLVYVIPAAVLYGIGHIFGLPFFLKAVGPVLWLAWGLGQVRGQGRLVYLDMVLAVAILAMLPRVYHAPVFSDRSFFSILRVQNVDSPYGSVHKFIHGDTVHNYQLRDPELQTIPLAYYGPDNSFDRALRAKRRVTPNMHVAMIGLGAGAMACQQEPGDTWIYYEIDQAVVDMAKNANYFSYLKHCAPNANIITGDARLTIKNLKDQSQDMIIIDAFASDSVPAHLVTREAMRLYNSKLKPDGVMFFHTSNRIMDISSVVVQTANAEGFSSRYIHMHDFDDVEYGEFYTESFGVLVGDETVLRSATSNDKHWKSFQPSRSVRPWTDDFSSIVGPIKSHLFKDAKSTDIIP